MARSTPNLPKPPSSSGATCEECGASVKRVTDLPRHMLIHAKNKEEFMFTCPVEGCSHSTLQKSNLEVHIRTHTRAKPHKCPEYYPNGQKCLFATADPSSLHRHRKRKHGYKPRSTVTSSGPVASGSGAREKSEESAVSFESEESFGLRPEASDVDRGVASQPSANTLSYSFVHGPYLTSNKISGYHYAAPYYPPLDLKIPDWIGSPPQLPSTFQALACGPDYGNVLTSSPEFPSSASTSDVAMLWPEMVLQDRYCHYDPAPQTYPDSSTPVSYSSPLHFQQEIGTFSKQAFSEHSGFALESVEYLELPADLFPSCSIMEQPANPEWQ